MRQNSKRKLEQSGCVESSLTSQQFTSPSSTWIKYKSARFNEYYWYNTQTGHSQWEHPMSLTSSSYPWIQCCTTNDPNMKYFFNVKTNGKSWVDPTLEVNIPELSITTDCEEVISMMQKEDDDYRINAPTFPRKIDDTDISELIEKLRDENAICESGGPGLIEKLRHYNAKGERGGDRNKSIEFAYVFFLEDECTGDITRAVQEEEILGTQLKKQNNKTGKVEVLPSFWEVWFDKVEGVSGKQFQTELTSAENPHEAKWALSLSNKIKNKNTYGYKMATTFMPGYAKAIFEFFGARTVLDPCAGWGDRLVGAAAAGLKAYVAFDPNKRLRRGYKRIMEACGHACISGNSERLHFDNNFSVHSLPFEEGAKTVLKHADNSFDLVFTSPPFFDYEIYIPTNPKYKDWISEFYEPLMTEACRCVKPGHFVCIHIGDTSAGQIAPFLQNEVHKFCSLRLQYKLGLFGIYSKEIREVWVFQKVGFC